MKNLIFIFIIVFTAYSQENKQTNSYVDINYFTGKTLLHQQNLRHLITGNPEGFFLSWNKKTFGVKEWQHIYNYPDYGISFSYQDLKNEIIGENYALYAHFNYYLFKRKLIIRIGEGLALTTKPYDKETNNKNNVFGSKIMESTFLMLAYKKERILGGLGLQTGVSFSHYSNGKRKAPNSGLNTLSYNLGLTYNLDKVDSECVPVVKKPFIRKPVKYNFALRTGLNEAFEGSGSFPFYVFSMYADKRLNKKSSIQFGGDVFISKFLKEYIYHRGIAYPEFELDPNTDYKRAGVLVGHELFINKLTLLTQFGYYVYAPFEYGGKLYQRVGLNYYFTDKIFGSVSLKTHFVTAEAVEFGIGIRL